MRRIKGLDAMRAVASIFVLIYHIEVIRFLEGYDNMHHLPFYENTGGHIGVVLFFVLSGFLITTLLLKEKSKTGTVWLKGFYMRRILRVWPVYYLTILLSWLLLDFNPSFITASLCLTIFPNIAHSLGVGWEASPQIWSIGVEEQFYLVWPLLLRFAKHISIILVAMLIVLLVLPEAVYYIFTRVGASDELRSFALNYFGSSKYICMVIGACVAILNIRFKGASIVPTIAIMLLPFLLWFTGTSLGYFTDECYALLFGAAILFMINNDSVSSYLENKLLVFLGRISYGIYMYHWIVISLLVAFVYPRVSSLGLFGTFSLYALSLGITISLSWLSFRYFESYFLRKKDLIYNRH